jgi:hypothetical protein
VIVALSLLSSAAMASAERAWVLWTHFTEAETGKPDRTTLDPTSAFESKTECDAAHSNIKGSNHQLQMEGATAMLQVTERARKSFKSTLEQLVEDPDAMLRIGRTDSGLGLFPDTQKDDDQVILHEGALCSSSTRKCPRRSRTRPSTSRIMPTAHGSSSGDEHMRDEQTTTSTPTT